MSKKVKLLVFVVTLFITTIAFAMYQNKHQVIITAHNPYRVKINLLVKCDWDHKQQDFKYKRRITLLKKHYITIRIPSHFQKCEVWPKIKWM